LSQVGPKLLTLPEHMGFSGARVARSLVFYVMVCTAFFVLFRLAIVLSVLRLTASNYPFGVFKPFSVIRSQYFVYIFSNKMIKVSNAHGAMLDLTMNAKAYVIMSRHHI